MTTKTKGRAGWHQATQDSASAVNSSPVENLLQRLYGVRNTGAGRWIACCPAHEDRRPSLNIRQLDDGRLLLHCFAGCSAHEVCAAACLELSDLFPSSEINRGKRERRPFNAIDILQCVAFEALVVAFAAIELRKRAKLTEESYERLMLAASRLQQAAEVAGDA